MKKYPILAIASVLLCSCGAPLRTESHLLKGSQTEASVSAFSEDGSLVAVGYGKRITPRLGKPDFIDAKIKVYSSESQEVLAELITGEHGLPLSLSFSNDGKGLLVGYQRGAVLWDILEKKPLHTYLPKAHTGFDNPPPMQVTACDFSPDGEHVLLAGGIQIFIYATNSEKVVTAFKTPWIKSAIYLSERRIATGHAGVANDVRIFDPSSGKYMESFKCRGEIKNLYHQDEGDRLHIAAFNPKDSGAIDIYMWNLADTKNTKKRFSLSGHKDNINGVVFMPSEDVIITSSYDRKMRVWDSRSGRLIKTESYSKVLSSRGSNLVAGNFNPFLINLK